MTALNSMNAILDFAIEREQEAVDFYTSLAETTDNAALKKTLTAFAGVELKHKEKLQAAQAEEVSLADEGEKGVVDLKIADYMVDVQPSPDMTLQDALVIAMKREKAAMDLYADLAEIVSNPSLKALFNKLAREERTHKLSFETAYEDHFMSDN